MEIAYTRFLCRQVRVLVSARLKSPLLPFGEHQILMNDKPLNPYQGIHISKIARLCNF